MFACGAPDRSSITRHLLLSIATAGTEDHPSEKLDKPVVVPDPVHHLHELNGHSIYLRKKRHTIETKTES